VVGSSPSRREAGGRCLSRNGSGARAWRRCWRYTSERSLSFNLRCVKFVFSSVSSIEVFTYCLGPSRNCLIINIPPHDRPVISPADSLHSLLYQGRKPLELYTTISTLLRHAFTMAEMGKEIKQPRPLSAVYLSKVFKTRGKSARWQSV
jgi:hypothetical protein